MPAKTMSRLLLASCATVIAIGSVATVVRSADEANKPSDEEQKKMMEMFMKLAQPGDEHKRIEAQFAGEWDAAVKSCSGDPSAPMEESKGALKCEMVLGGRYLHQNYAGKMMEMDYQGMGILGFDNASKKYFAGWIDNMSTGIMNTEGDYDEATQTYTLTGSFNDPTKPSGKCSVRETIKVTDNDHHVLSMYMPGPDGKEALMAEITYSRKK